MAGFPTTGAAALKKSAHASRYNTNAQGAGEKKMAKKQTSFHLNFGISLVSSDGDSSAANYSCSRAFRPTIHAMRRRRRRRNKSGKFHRCKTIRGDRRNGFSPHHKLFSYKNISMPLAPRPILLHYARCHGRSQEAHFRAQLCGEGWDG